MFHSKDLVLPITAACRPELGELGGNTRPSASWARQARCRGRDAVCSSLLLPLSSGRGSGGGQGKVLGKAGLELPFGRHKLLLKHSPRWGWGDLFRPGDGLTATEGHHEAWFPAGGVGGRLRHPGEVGGIWVVRSGRGATHSSGKRPRVLLTPRCTGQAPPHRLISAPKCPQRISDQPGKRPEHGD